MEPKVYSSKEHKIPIDKIDHHAIYIIEKLKHAGFIAYLVGGSVRDLILGLKPKDFDISTSAKPEEIKKLFKSCILIGKRFRLAHIRFGKKIIEVSTFRSGDIEEKNLILRDNVWGSPKEDAKRRDFTINGLFYDTETEEIIDFVNGFDDALKKQLRAIGTASLRFSQDPVRMIRLIKFKARFNFDIDEDTHTSLIECRENILKSSQARILEEFFRMLESGYSSNFFKLLKSFGFLKLLVPKLDEFMETDLSIYKYLNAADDLILKDFRHKMDRAILTCCLLFPIMETEINTLFEKMKKIHLGLIYDTGREVIKNTFSSFFYIPKRTKAQVNSILTNQYRLTPIDNKKKLVRIPRDSFFYLAMKFFKIRCSLNPDLLETYILWNEKITKLHKKRQGRRRKV